MSSKYTIIPTAACTDKRLIPQHLRVLAIISGYGNQTDEGRISWPSYKRLSSDVGISRRLLIKYINHLCDCGYIVKEARVRSDGGRKSNRYRVIIDIVIDPEIGDAPVHQSEQPRDKGMGVAPVDGLNMNTTKEEQSNKKNIIKKSQALSLEDWEKKVGCQLCIEQMANWIKENKLDEGKVKSAIPLFREKIISQGKMYADFRATFQVWLRQGWLGIPFELFHVAAPFTSQVKIIDKGLSL